MYVNKKSHTTSNFIFVIALFLLFNFNTSAQEEIDFTSGGTTLSGTLILPKGTGPFPAVIFIHGSGAEERSVSRSRAKEFARNGIAAFIYDKRGVGKSEGNKNFYQYYSFDTLAMDAGAAVEMLIKRQDIIPAKVGLVAASQGGWVAPLLAGLNKNISFMIIISGSVSTPGEDNLFERSARLKYEGFSATDVEEAEKMHLVDQEVSRSSERFDEFKKMWDLYKNSKWFKRVYLSDEPTPVNSKYRQWYKTILDFNPVIYLKELAIPVLWLYGDAELDRFCPVQLSVQRLNELIKTGKDYKVVQIPGADHSLTIKSKDFLLESMVFEWLKSKL